MKGVIYGILDQIHVVDITHLIRPQDIAAGAFALYSACRFFPKDTVHVGVVDPGVGSARRGIVVETNRFKYVGPDNGLFSAVYENEVVQCIVAIENTDLMRPVVSSTFHGRDIFACVGAHLLNGVSCAEVGREIEDPVKQNLWAIKENTNELEGHIVCIDHFGNAISMISRSQIVACSGGRNFEISVGDACFDRVCDTYAQVGKGAALALYGSLDTLEIAVNSGSAAVELGIMRGDLIRVRFLD